MNVNVNLDASVSEAASLATSMITGLFPGPPGAGRAHPFELRAGPWLAGELQVISLRGRERVNDMYRYDVVFATSQPPELVTSALFEMPACLTIKSPGHDPRVIQGIAVAIEALGGVAGEQGSKRRRYSLSIVPRLWLLDERRRNRIFQNKTVPEIVKAVLAGAEIQDSDCRWRANRPAYPKLPFVYQRGETDWDFLRRILASAGIFFFYEHASGFLDSLFGPAASAVAGAVGAAAGMLGGAIGSAVSTVESATGMVPVLNFSDEAGHTAAVASALGGVAADAVQAGLGALGGAIGGAVGAAVSAVAGAIEEPSDTIAFDDDMGADADVDRVYEFGLKKTLRTKELRMLDRDVETATSWVGVTSVGGVGASLNVSAGVSVSAGLSLSGSLSAGGAVGALTGGLSAAAGLGASLDPIPPSMLRQEIYQEDFAVWQDGIGPDAEPAVALSASLTAAGVTVAATAQTAGDALASAFKLESAKARRLQMELERIRRKHQEARGRSDCRRMGAGYRFTLGAHPIKMVNGEYTITQLDVVGVHPDFLADGQAVYRNRFRCIPSHVAPRPKRPTHRPKPGMEVARVVGFIGNDQVPGLEANPAGYVRVRFRWDIVDDDYATPRGELQIGATDTDDVYSVWLPVVQPWAGAGYGAQFIPREGMEVLVGFMENQSERPVILGCLYSNENQPPWPEYIDHQKIGIKSRSRPADGGWSEISIDDRRESELVHVRAQRDLDVTVVRESRTFIGANDTKTVRGGRSAHIFGDRTDRVDGSTTWTVGGRERVHIATDRTTEIGGTSTHRVRQSETISVDGSRNVVVKAGSRHETAGNRTTSVGGDDIATIGHRHVVTIGAAGTQEARSNTYVWGECRLGSKDRLILDSETEIVLRCGKSELHLKPDGITLAGKSVQVSASQQVALSGNGPSLSLSDSAQLTSKQITLVSTAARLSLSDSAVLTSASVTLGKPTQDVPPSTKSTDPDPDTFRLTVVGPDHTPLANCNYLLELGGTTTEGTTDGAGTVTGKTPKDVKAGRCTVWTADYPTGPRLTFDLNFEKLEPATDLAGAQKRLRNLGYYNGEATTEMNHHMRDAILVFQHTHGLPRTGLIDDTTSAKLAEIHP